MNTRQLIVIVCACTLLTLGLAWFLERFQADAFHAEIRDYMTKWDRFRLWEAEQGGAKDE